jgi:hypothetical protein
MCEHTEHAETDLAGLVHENNELRAIIRRVREYAHLQHELAETYENVGGASMYIARLHDEVAVSLERIIGDKP